MKTVGVPFTKMQGTGNSFIFVDLRSPKAKASWQKAFGRSSRKRMAKTLCDPFIGIGADGFALFENTTQGAAVKWDFYNSDGSQAEMCGNAARCAGLYLTKGTTKRPFKMRTKAGVLEIQVHTPDIIDVEMTRPKGVKLNQKLRVGGKNIHYHFVDTGVPHAVIQVKKLILNDKYRELARMIQKSSKFGTKSTNVTFYEVTGSGSVKTASFERGVFDFTRACGTGAVAAAYVYANKNKPNTKRVKLMVPGGKLVVDLANSRPHLIGPAKRVAEFKIYNL